MRVADGDPIAEAEMVERYRAGLLVLLRHHVHGAGVAEDLCQETLLLGLQGLHAHRLHNADALAAYLRGIALHLAHREHRRARLHAEAELTTDAKDPARDPEQQAARAERARLVQALLRRLSLRDRRLLAQLYIGDGDKAEICRRLRLTPDQFDVVKHRALERLGRLWDGFEPRGDRTGAHKTRRR